MELPKAVLIVEARCVHHSSGFCRKDVPQDHCPQHPAVRRPAKPSGMSGQRSQDEDGGVESAHGAPPNASRNANMFAA